MLSPPGSALADAASCAASSGNYCPENTSSVLPCPDGHFCVGGTDKQECNPGTFSNATGLSACYACRTPPGNYCPNASIAASPGDTCPAGHFCVGGAADKEACPGGYWSANTGASSNSTCTPCTAAPGYFCPAGSVSSTALLCPSGYLCVGGARDKTICGPGTYSLGETLCALCPAGTYASQRGISECDLCAEGKYSLEVGATSDSTCMPCTVIPGYYCPSGSQSRSGGPCPIGFLCEGGTARPCPAGTYSDRNGAESCTLCAVGKYSAIIGATNAFVCSPCMGLTPGMFCAAGSFKVSGSMCPEGYFCTDGERVECSAGSFATAGASACSLCSPGTYSGLKGASSCSLCVEGKYSTMRGSANYNTCWMCPDGKYSGEGSSACAASTEWKYRMQDGSVGRYRTLDGLAIQPFPAIHPSHYYADYTFI